MFTGLKKMAALAGLLGGLSWSGMPATAADSVPLSPAAAPMDAAPDATPAAPPVRMALLLPNRGGTFGAAADAMRTGFLTAYSRQKENIQLAVIETGDSVQDMQRAYDDASAKFDILVGPLSRSAVTAVAHSGRVVKPTIALAQPDLPGEAEAQLPPLMLSVGLSIDDEARQVANWVEKEKAPGKIFAVATAVAWQKRAVRSFQARARQLGLQVETMELSTPGNALSAPGLAQLAKRIEQEKPALLFAALDAAQAVQLRSAVGGELPVYGTSQINPFTLDRSNPNDTLPELDGVRLIDIPWQLQPDNVAVAHYPRPTGGDNERPNPDLARLYALGIDAYRIAHEIAQQRSGFDLDGVTGRLNVNLGVGGATYFQRQETQAVFQNGLPVPTADQY
jgi:outer membrane PBP1 activator LpoA protein